MSVLIETSLGDLVVDLLIESAPKSCENFLKLCKVKYYNYSPIFNVQRDFSFQKGDPLGPSSKDSDGGTSIWGLLQGPSAAEFEPEMDPKMKHAEAGTVSMATVAHATDDERRLASSQFIVSLADHTDQLNGRAAIFGKIVEGFDVLKKINEAFVDSKGSPLRDIRIRHTVVLDDPFPDPRGLREPSQSPMPSASQLATVRIADDEQLDEDVDEEAMEELRRQREAKAQALTLEMVGDLPFAEVRPPENVLFVCKLNPVTQDDDIHLIFSRFGKIISCEVIRDKKTGDSLQYAFVEFENKSDCEQAYFKMQGVLIDDHRIHVDFSQSVSRLSDTWRTATNSRRRRQANFGGISGLEKRRQYRNVEDQDSERYGLVFDKHGVDQRRFGDRRNRYSQETRHHSPSRSSRRDRSKSPSSIRRSHSPPRDKRRRRGDGGEESRYGEKGDYGGRYLNHGSSSSRRQSPRLR